jgi:HEAT repeat protein
MGWKTAMQRSASTICLGFNHSKFFLSREFCFMSIDPTQPKEKTVSELFAETLVGEYDDDNPWDAVWALIKIETPEVFETAVEFCNSVEPLKRARGLNILAHFGCYTSMKGQSDPHIDERIAIALDHLSDESEMVVESAAWALSHMRGKRAVNGLLTLRHNANANVRHAVAAGLVGEVTPEAVDALIELMQDSDDDVRDWATFSLGQDGIDGQILDLPKIREALRSRLADTHEDTRKEAIWGLAKRKDPEGLRILLEHLDADQWLSGDEDVAKYLLNISSDTSLTNLRDKLCRLIIESEQKNST